MKHYPPQFKADAVALYHSRPGASATQVARDLGSARRRCCRGSRLRLAGFAIADNMRTELVLDALAEAQRTRGSPAGAIVVRLSPPDGVSPDGAGSLTFPERFTLPVTVNLATAARAFGFSVKTAYRLVGRDAFPCRVLRPTYRYRVPTTSLMTALEIELSPIRTDDLQESIDFARQHP